MPGKIVFLDRDGTINIDRGYTHRIEDFELIGGVVEGLHLLTGNGYRLVVVSNQSGIGKKLFTMPMADDFNKHLIKELKKHNINIEKVYMCPHLPQENCQCRKPNFGLVKQAEKELKISSKGCWFVGDKTCDIKLGSGVGCKTILLETGKRGLDKEFDVDPNFKAKNMQEAAKIILKNDAKKDSE